MYNKTAHLFQINSHAYRFSALKPVPLIDIVSIHLKFTLYTNIRQKYKTYKMIKSNIDFIYTVLSESLRVSLGLSSYVRLQLTWEWHV